MTRINSYGVARQAGVSRSVVSKVINGSADKYQIARSTQERVMAVVRQTGYTPDLTLRNMFLGRGSGIDLEVLRLMEAGQIAPALDSILAEKGYRLAPVSESLPADPAPRIAPVPEQVPRESAASTDYRPPTTVTTPTPPHSDTSIPPKTETSSPQQPDRY